MLLRRSTLRSPQLARKKKKQFWTKFGILVFVVLFLVAAPAVVSHLSFTKISNIEVKGVSAMSREALVQYVDKQISKNFLGIFSRKNILLYPRKTVEKDLIEEFPEISKVGISFNNFNSISVDVLEKSPTAVWCAGNPIIGDGRDQSCYLIDEKGLVFAQAPSFSGDVYSRFYGLLDPQNPIGSQYLVYEEYRSLKAFLKNISSLGVDVAGVFLDKEEGEVFTKFGNRIVFKRSTSLETTSEQIDLLLKDRMTVLDRETFLKDVEYIDARIANKVFFKMRGQNENRPQP